MVSSINKKGNNQTKSCIKQKTPEQVTNFDYLAYDVSLGCDLNKKVCNTMSKTQIMCDNIEKITEKIRKDTQIIER